MNGTTPLNPSPLNAKSQVYCLNLLGTIDKGLLTYLLTCLLACLIALYALTYELTPICKLASRLTPKAFTQISPV